MGMTVPMVYNLADVMQAETVAMIVYVAMVFVHHNVDVLLEIAMVSKFRRYYHYCFTWLWHLLYIKSI